MGNTMKAADLHRVITEAKNFAGRDATLPMLQNVRIEATETQLVAVATDRFLLGASRADYAGESFTVSIEAQQVDALLRMAKTASRDALWREVTIERRDDDSHNVIEFRFNSGEAITVTPSAHEFPKYQQLIPTTTQLETETRHESPVIGFNAANLAKFAKIDGARAMRVYPRGDKPTHSLCRSDTVFSTTRYRPCNIQAIRAHGTEGDRLIHWPAFGSEHTTTFKNLRNLRHDCNEDSWRGADIACRTS